MLFFMLQMDNACLHANRERKCAGKILKENASVSDLNSCMYMSYRHSSFHKDLKFQTSY